MFAEIKPSTPDPIMSLMEAYLQDRNPRKVNLGIGLYYDERGEVPLMRAVELAEQRLLAQQQPHGYPPIEGSASFASQVQALLLGPAAPEHALATVQTVGGSGALKLAADFLAHFLQRKEIWVSDPTWANHQAIFSGAGLQVNSYPYFDNLRGELRFADMLAVLQTLPAGTAVLLHPCCHNPTGTDLSRSQWQTLLGVVQAQRLLPFFDIAYQGFGDGLEEDCYALRLALESDLDFIVANSFSKNIALYGQRVGGLTVRCANAQTAANVQGALKTLIRRSYSCPPTHGSRIVDMVLADAQLRQLWLEELATMRQRIQQMRQRLSAGLQQGGSRLDYRRIRDQRGMFSYTGLDERQVSELRQRYAIYLVAPGRMCLPGLNGDNIDYVTAAILDVTTAGR
ncbi:aromatic amino acid transaminase [Raoultella planticola]|uniref:amino acid aminotransferase n=1 Tax=Raoultella planticola TaxID=575 RepID=UPI003DA9317E